MFKVTRNQPNTQSCFTSMQEIHTVTVSCSVQAVNIMLFVKKKEKKNRFIILL